MIRKLPNLLKPASNTTQIIFGSIGKCVYESILLKTEFTYYSHLLGLFTLVDIVCPINDPPIIINGLVGMTCISSLVSAHPTIIPIIRTSYKIYKKNIHTINL